MRLSQILCNAFLLHLCNSTPSKRTSFYVVLSSLLSISSHDFSLVHASVFLFKDLVHFFFLSAAGFCEILTGRSREEKS